MQTGLIGTVKWTYDNEILTFSPYDLVHGEMNLSKFWHRIDFRPKIVEFEKGVALTTCMSAFEGLSCEVLNLTNLEIPVNDKVLDMFNGEYGEIIGLDTLDFSRYVTLNGMFIGCKTNIVDLSKNIFKQVVQAQYMFKDSKIGEVYLPEAKELHFCNNIFLGADIGKIESDGVFNNVKLAYFTFLDSHIGEILLPNLVLKPGVELLSVFANARIDTLDISSFSTAGIKFLGNIFPNAKLNEIHIKDKQALEDFTYNGLGVDN